MARKGKAPGGHNPLTYHERKAKLADYGTQTARLGTDSQMRFGYCCLGLEPARDPVATPSREAIVSYLLSKTRELKDRAAKSSARLAAGAQKRAEEEEAKSAKSADTFLRGDQGPIRQSSSAHATSYEAALQKKISTETREEGLDSLKRTSYWLSEFNPEHRGGEGEEEEDAGGPPSSRPASPMSGAPLRMKDLTPLELKREDGGGSNGGTGRAGDDLRFVCAISGKAITTQPVVAIKKSGQVMLTSVYEELVKGSAVEEARKKTKKRKQSADEEGDAVSTISVVMRCPVTGIKFKEKDLIHLQKAASGFAASGPVEAKKYRATLT